MNEVLASPEQDGAGADLGELDLGLLGQDRWTAGFLHPGNCEADLTGSGRPAVLPQRTPPQVGRLLSKQDGGNHSGTQSKPLIPAVTCEGDEEDVLGVVGEQECVEAAEHREVLVVTAGVQLMTKLWKSYLSTEKFWWSQLVYN